MSRSDEDVVASNNGDNNNGTTNRFDDPDGSKMSVFVIVRHGERLDYVEQENGRNWVASHRQQRPWDPPLTQHGQWQAQMVGREIERILDRHALPPVSHVYTSPLWRCRQTAQHAFPKLPMRIEEGLIESLNESWYRSWALPGSDGSWGYGDRHYDIDTLHEMSKRPVQDIPRDACRSRAIPSAAAGLEKDEEDPSSSSSSTMCIDATYSSQVPITEPYCFHPNFMESRSHQRQRMKQVAETVIEPGNTIVAVSHGGPVTHLYEELTGNPWYIHGESTYCCYSIYIYKHHPNNNNNDHQGTTTLWQPFRINQSSFLHEQLHRDRYVTDTSD